jgi:hypothetical protein
LDRHKQFTEAADGFSVSKARAWCLLNRALAPLFVPAIIIIRNNFSQEQNNARSTFFRLLPRSISIGSGNKGIAIRTFLDGYQAVPEER